MKEIRNADKDGNIFSREMDRRAFLQKTTLAASATIGISFANSLNVITASAASSASIMNSAGKPDLVFPVISDIHIHNSSNKTLEKFITTLEQLNKAVPKQDAFVVVGDLTDYGYESEFDKFMSAYNVHKQPGAVPMFAIGNHDYWNGLSVSEAQKRFLSKTGMESIRFHKVIKGYHFIILGTEDGLTEGTFSDEQINWLGEQLKIAHEDDWKKPIFVFHHQPIKGTI